MPKEPEDFKVIDRRGVSSETPETSEKKNVASSSSSGPSKPTAQDAATGGTEVDFITLIMSIATGALINLGIAPDATTKKTEKNIPLARHNIEILNLLKEKTKGNLTPDETALLNNILTEVRLRFVEATK